MLHVRGMRKCQSVYLVSNVENSDVASACSRELVPIVCKASDVVVGTCQHNNLQIVHAALRSFVQLWAECLKLGGQYSALVKLPEDFFVCRSTCYEFD